MYKYLITLFTLLLFAKPLDDAYLCPAYFLNERQKCDLELLLDGSFAPLSGFLCEEDYLSVVENCRLADGTLWPLPIVLSIPEQDIEKYQDSEKMTLMDAMGYPIAFLHIEQIYKPDIHYECEKVFGTTDTNHPYVKHLLQKPNVYYVGGSLTEIHKPVRCDYANLRLTPKETREFFAENGWEKVVGFQTRNPMHRSHFALTLQSAEKSHAKIFLHPTVGVAQDCDIDYQTRVRCYKKMLSYYPKDSVKLAILPLAMRMAGPREALLHALVRKNYGCTHFVVGRDHAGPTSTKSDGSPFYGPYDAHTFLEKYADEIGLTIVPSTEIVYAKETNAYLPVDQVPIGSEILRISGTKFRKMLAKEQNVPSWFSFPEVFQELQKTYAKSNGFCVYFVGLSGSGKSTIAQALCQKIQELDPLNRKVTFLDGDIIRRHLSKGLGFTKKDRSINVQRIGYVSSLVVRNGGICICANIAPYAIDRDINRDMIAKEGQYIEVFVDTPLEVCEKRDAKGLYKAARSGVIQNFTGISDPFEKPENPEVCINGDDEIDHCLEQIIDHLKEKVDLW